MKYNKKTLHVLVLFALAISIFVNAYQFIENRKIKISYGDIITDFECISLWVIPNEVKFTLEEDNLYSDAGMSYLKLDIGHTKIAKLMSINSDINFPNIDLYLEETNRDLNNLYRLIENNSDVQERDQLVKKIIENQDRALEIFYKIEQIKEKYKLDSEEHLTLERPHVKMKIKWFENNFGKSNEIREIIENGFQYFDKVKKYKCSF